MSPAFGASSTLLAAGTRQRRRTIRGLGQGTGQLAPTCVSRHEQAIESVRAQLGNETFAAGHAAGRTVSLAEAIGGAMQESTYDVPGHVVHELPQLDH